MTKDEMVGWHHRLDGHGFGWTPGVGDGQRGLVCSGSMVLQRARHDLATEPINVNFSVKLHVEMCIEKNIGKNCS